MVSVVAPRHAAGSVRYTQAMKTPTCPTRRAVARALLLTGILTLSSAAHAGEFRVTPIRVDLAAGGKGSAVISVINEGQESISFQIQARAWTQDAAGKDVYADTTDLIFFPQLMTAKGGETKVVRVGTKAPAPPLEKSYRLFIEEIPRREEAKGAVVRVAFRFGVPVFRLPVLEKREGSIEDARVEKGTLSLQLRNTGTVHLKFDELEVVGKDAAGTEVFREKPASWYVLTGSSRLHTLPIPAEICARIGTLRVSTRSEEVILQKELTAGEGWCP